LDGWNMKKVEDIDIIKTLMMAKIMKNLKIMQEVRGYISVKEW
jgi:hypothetical protein